MTSSNCLIFAIFSSYIPVDDFNMVKSFYEAPWTRAQPYLMGILLAYILFKTKDQEINIHWVGV